MTQDKLTERQQQIISKAADAVIFIERADTAPLPPDGGTDAATDKGGGQ